MKSPVISRLLGIVLCAFSIAAGAQIDLPIGPVPLSLQTLFVLLAGLLLGPIFGTYAVALYLLVGLLGAPVFAGGTSGAARLLGPTGGFLFGFLPAAALMGWAARDRDTRLGWVRGTAWGLLATGVIFLCGIPWLKFSLGIDWWRAIEVGMLPFLPGGLLKAVLAVSLYRLYRLSRQRQESPP